MVTTTYDEMRNQLRDDLTQCLERARELLDESIQGYEDMRKDYAMELYIAVKKARDSV